MSRDFPASAIGWVKSTPWQGPQQVPLSQVDMDDRDDWNASRPDAARKIKRLRKKLRRDLAKGRNPKPVVLVRPLGSEHDIIVDGHHHVLAAEAEGQHFIWAYVGHVDSQDGPWNVTAARELRGKKAA